MPSIEWNEPSSGRSLASSRPPARSQPQQRQNAVDVDHQQRQFAVLGIAEVVFSSHRGFARYAARDGRYAEFARAQ